MREGGQEGEKMEKKIGEEMDKEWKWRRKIREDGEGEKMDKKERRWRRKWRGDGQEGDEIKKKKERR